MFGADAVIAVGLVSLTLFLGVFSLQATAGRASHAAGVASMQRTALAVADVLVKARAEEDPPGIAECDSKFVFSHEIGGFDAAVLEEKYSSLTGENVSISAAPPANHSKRLGEGNRVCIKRLALSGQDVVIVEACVSRE